MSFFDEDDDEPTTRTRRTVRAPRPRRAAPAGGAGVDQQTLWTRRAVAIGGGLVVFILLVLLVWAASRVAWVRRARALGREVADPQSQQLLALRALVHQDPRRLQSLHPDPVGAWRSGDPEAVRALADLELAQVGLRSR